MESSIPFIITPMIINGLVLWDYTQKAFFYELFLMLSEDDAWYSPILFERL